VLLFKRPSKPPGFEDEMKPHRQAVQDLVDAGEALSFVQSAWQKYKMAFVDAQHEKCGFCEQNPTRTGHGAVDHFRPKKSVSKLVVKAAEKDEGLPNVEGGRCERIKTGPLRRGYWWLAYDWQNWLYICGLCNSTWKKDIFPLAAEPIEKSPGPGVEDRPLLLHPYGQADPALHLTFDEEGQVEGLSRRGRETVRTLGLDRNTTRKHREKVAMRIHHLVNQVRARLDAGADPEGSDLRDLLKEGDASEEYAGMVRIIFEQYVPTMTWAELGFRVQKL
jgi:hypothetical protein